MRTPWLAAGLVTLAILLAPAAGAVSVRFAPQTLEVVEGSLFSVELLADLEAPVLGWGLDFAAVGSFPPGGAELIRLEGAPLIGPAWLPVAAPDGDGLAGAAFPAGIAGDGVLLATLSFRALSPGSAFLSPTATPGDLTEGFALDPSGFATELTFVSASVTVRPVPEPSTLLLVATGLLALARRRRSA